MQRFLTTWGEVCLWRDETVIGKTWVQDHKHSMCVSASVSVCVYLWRLCVSLCLHLSSTCIVCSSAVYCNGLVHHFCVWICSMLVLSCARHGPAARHHQSQGLDETFILSCTTLCRVTLCLNRESWASIPVTYSPSLSSTRKIWELLQFKQRTLIYVLKRVAPSCFQHSQYGRWSPTQMYWKH